MNFKCARQYSRLFNCFYRYSIAAGAAVLLFLTFSNTAYAEVLYSQNFDREAAPWRSGPLLQYGNYGKDGRGVRIAHRILRGADSSGRSIRGSDRQVSNLNIKPVRAATLSYDIRYDNNWNTTLGGKYHGLGPKNHVTGCRSSTPDGWSARVTIRDRRPSLYLYFQGKQEDCGQQLNANMVMEKNRWYRISIYIQLNDYNRDNAVARLYVDGRQVAQKTGFQFHNSRSSDALIQKFMFSTFLGHNIGNVVEVQDTQHVYFDNVLVTDDDGAGGGGTPPVGAANLQAKHSNKCVDIAGGSSANGANALQWSCHNGDNQKFRLVSRGGDWYNIVVSHSNKCLTVAQQSRENAGNIDQYTCGGGQNQQFRRDDMGNGWFRLRGRQSNLCIDVPAASSDNGANIQQWRCHNGDNQQFRFD